MGTELAKFAVEIVGFMMVRILKPIFNVLKPTSHLFSEQFSIYFKAIIFSDSLEFPRYYKKLRNFSLCNRQSGAI